MTDTYTGEVAVGGDWDVRELPGLTVTKLAVGRLNNNAYLLRCTASGEGLLIDAAAEAARLAELVRFGGPPVAAVLTTHRHPDHWGALAAVVTDARAAVFAGDADASELPVAVDERLIHGDVLTVGEIALSVIALRGHTPGSVAVCYQPATGPAHLFTGDSLFPGGVGRTASAADFQSLIDDVEARVFDVLSDDTWVYPGHGSDTTLGVERPALPAWRARGW